MGALIEMRHRSKTSSLIHAGVARCSHILQSCKSRTHKTPVEYSAVQKKTPAINTNFLIVYTMYYYTTNLY